MEWYGLTVLHTYNDQEAQGTVFGISSMDPDKEAERVYTGEVIDIDEDPEYIKELFLDTVGDLPDGTIIITSDKDYQIKEYHRETVLSFLDVHSLIILPYFINIENITYYAEELQPV